MIKLDTITRKNFLAFHAVTDCDTDSEFSGIGKKLSGKFSYTCQDCSIILMLDSAVNNYNNTTKNSFVSLMHL